MMYTPDFTEFKGHVENIHADRKESFQEKSGE